MLDGVSVVEATAGRLSEELVAQPIELGRSRQLISVLPVLDFPSAGLGGFRRMRIFLHRVGKI